MNGSRLRPPRVIPVLDVLNGQVVRAVGGRRNEYRPVVSTLTTSTDPVAVAEALRRAAGANELYVADLGAICHGVPDLAVDALLSQVKATILLDRNGLAPSREPHVREILSLEAKLPRTSHEQRVRGGRPVFSIDLMNGRLVDGWQQWGIPSAAAVPELARTVYDLGYRSLIVLDVGRVGLGEGAGTEATLTAIRHELADVELIAGGGVRGWDDVERLGSAGADAVLVASALHDGTLTFPPPDSSAPHP